MIELMTCGELERVAYRNGTPEFEEQAKALRDQFGALSTDNWFSVSTPQYNDIYDDDIVSIVYVAIPTYLHHLDIGAAGRKYFLRNGWVYDKVYLFIPPGQRPLPQPEGARGMYVGYLANVYGQPGDADLTRYRCLYFMHPDHAAVEAWAGQSLPQGKYSTFYSATFDADDGNRLLRMKTYTYDEQGELFSDWDVTYLRHCKRRGLVDALIESN